MPDWFPDLITILIALLLVLVNAFFVAAEFALVKVRLGRIEQMVLNRKLASLESPWRPWPLGPSVSLRLLN